MLNTHTSEPGEVDQGGPLAEVEHWKNRCADLQGISRQLDHPTVVHIVNVLKAAKSSYLAPFLKTAGEIQVGGQETGSS